MPAGETFNAVTSPEAFTLTKLGFEVTLQVALPVKFLWLPSSNTPVACSCSVLPTFCRLVDCSVDTVMLVSVGSIKNPWQPTAAAIKTRTLKDPITWSLRRERELDIDADPRSQTLDPIRLGVDKIVADYAVALSLLRNNPKDVGYYQASPECFPCDFQAAQANLRPTLRRLIIAQSS